MDAGAGQSEARPREPTDLAAVNSALQRARKNLQHRVPPSSQQEELAVPGDRGQRQLIDAFVSVWERAARRAGMTERV
jgi:RNA polymerase sigma-70 factor (ECF subfamily)